MSFEIFNLDPLLLRAVKDAGYEKPTPIQQRAIPLVMQGRDLLGAAQTGTGKTAAFALPLLHKLQEQQSAPRGPRAPRALVLVRPANWQPRWLSSFANSVLIWHNAAC